MNKNFSYLLVLGGNLMACHAIQRLKALGHKVLVVDGNQESPAKDIANLFICQDFADVDATKKSVKKYRISGVMPLNDFAIASACAIARERGLPGWNEVAEACVRSKVAMKNAWVAAGLPTAKFAVARVEDVLQGYQMDWNCWPCVVKPSFSGGGSRGVFVANNWVEIRAGIASARNKYLSDELLLEEFLVGTEHTLEVLVCKSEPHLLSISDKENYSGSATVVQNLYFPGPIGNACRTQLETLVFAACRAMQLTDGAAHFEVIISEGRGYLLEVGGRPGGGLNFHPICELSTGYDYPGLLSAVLTGNLPIFSRVNSFHLAWHYFPEGRGLLKSVTGFDKIKLDCMVVDAMLYEEIGKPRFELSDDLARPGYLLVKGNTHVAARSHASMLVSKLKFQTSTVEEQGQ